jgi:hypothetical protein
MGITRQERERRIKQRQTTLLLTLQDASAQYGPPYTSLRDLVLEGALPRVTLGTSKRIWIRRADLERLIATSTEAA